MSAKFQVNPSCLSFYAKSVSPPPISNNRPPSPFCIYSFSIPLFSISVLILLSTLHSRAKIVELIGDENEEPEDIATVHYINKRKAIQMSINKVVLPNHLKKRVKSIPTPAQAQHARNLQYFVQKSSQVKPQAALAEHARNLQYSGEKPFVRVVPELNFATQTTRCLTQASQSSFKTCNEMGSSSSSSSSSRNPNVLGSSGSTNSSQSSSRNLKITPEKDDDDEDEEEEL